MPALSLWLFLNDVVLGISFGLHFVSWNRSLPAVCLDFWYQADGNMVLLHSSIFSSLIINLSLTIDLLVNHCQRSRKS